MSSQCQLFSISTWRLLQELGLRCRCVKFFRVLGKIIETSFWAQSCRGKTFSHEKDLSLQWMAPRAPSFSFSICFWSSNIFIWPGPKTLSMGFKTIHFFSRNHRYSSAGCILSWIAVSFVPDLDAPQNLGFGNISAPRKRLNYFQVVWWTKLLDLWLLSMSSSQLVLSFYFCFWDFDHCLCPQVFT